MISSLSNRSAIYKVHSTIKRTPTISSRSQHSNLFSIKTKSRNPIICQSSETNTPSTDNESIDLPPPGCARYSVTLSKPLGLVLEENKATGSIVVAEVLEGGNAQRSGEIGVGDVLIATSGYTRTTEQVYGETVVRGGEKIVRLSCRGESFDTVMAAISSNPAHIGVTLEFQRCE